MVRAVLAALLAIVVLTGMGPAYGQERMEVAQQQRRTLFDLLFGAPEPTPPPAQPAPRQQTAPAAPRPTMPAPVSLPPARPAIEKAEGATRLAVFGDSLSIDLARALDRHYAEDPNLVVIGQGVSSSGFVRDDYFDWNRAIAEQIAADAFDIAVINIGINDRQELRVDGRAASPLSEAWVGAYQARLAEVLNRLRAANKPVIWVGLPPMTPGNYGTAIAQIASIHRLASLSGGAEYIDVYERFLDENGRYSLHGPDLNGQNVRMRKDDGIHLSNAGSDKVAFFVSQAMRKFYREGTVSIEVADPLAGTDAGAMLRPPFQGLGQIRLLEVAGIVTPLARVPGRASDLVLAGLAPESSPPFPLEDLVRAPVGRADAFGVGVEPGAEAAAGGELLTSASADAE